MTEEYKNLQNLIETMESQIGILKDVIEEQKSMYGFTLTHNDTISTLINELNMSECTNHEIDNLLKKIAVIDKFESSYKNDSNWNNKDFYEYARYAIKDIQKSLNELNEIDNEKEKINEEIKKMTDNWFEYTNSEEYRNRREERLNNLRNQIESENDPVKKRKMEKALKDIKCAESLEFLFDRINKNGETEIENIKNIYFDKHRSSLIMKKFKSRIIKQGCNEEIYKMFFNIEEKFLPNEYHDFNNIFLFHVMRFVAHTDSYSKADRLKVSSILLKLYNLLYHKYPTIEMENDTINIIKKFDDYFFKFEDEFKERNVTSPNHPVRIKRDNEYEQKVRMMIIASLQNEGIEPDTRLSTEELRNMLQDIINKKQSESVDNTETDNVEDISETNDDIDVYVDPYNCVYMKNDDTTYIYKDLINDTIIEDDIDETVILQLLSTNSIEKSTLSEVNKKISESNVN